MNLTNDSGKYLNEKNSSSDEDEDEDETNRNYVNPPSICIGNFFSEHDHEEFSSSDDDDDDADDESDTENAFYSKNPLVPSNRLSSILRQSNRLVELKLNCFHNNRQTSNSYQSLRHALSDSEMSKRFSHFSNNRQEQDQQQSSLLSSFSSNNFHLSTNRAHRLYLPSSFLYDLQTQITNWLQQSTYLIDSISTLIYHRRCWPQLLLTHFIERGFTNLQFIRCTHLSTSNSISSETCSIPKHACVSQDEAYKLSSILQKGSRFQIDSIIFDHIRRIIVIKSMQEVINDNTNFQQIYVKQLKCLKQSLVHQQSSVVNINNNSSINVASIYSKLLLFLSSLYSIKSETMQTLFCQHLLHNPSYSYLIN